VRREKLLPGSFGSSESLAAKARLELELAASPTREPAPSPDLHSVAEFLCAYLDFAEQHYRGSDGKPTDEVRHIKAALRHVRELYAETPVTGFGPLALKAVWQRFVEQKWCRKTINARIERVRRIFKWAVAEELVAPAVYQALAAVKGLERGRTEAKEGQPVGPVDNATVDATLPFLNRHVRGLVEFQRLTGCRPGEACAVRRYDIDTGGAVWLYKPASHKTAWKGKTRIILIGPKAQALLREFFTPELNDYLFCPRRAKEEFIATRAAGRKTPLYPSHAKQNVKRRKANPKRKPTEKYTRQAYLTAIVRACDRAEVSHWHPNQLRHSFATQVRKQHGLEAAQVLLGHSRADVTQVYAERNEQLASTVAAQIG
jgi:integrase